MLLARPEMLPQLTAHPRQETRCTMQEVCPPHRKELHLERGVPRPKVQPPQATQEEEPRLPKPPLLADEDHRRLLRLGTILVREAVAGVAQLVENSK